MKMKQKFSAQQIREARIIIATVNSQKAKKVLNERFTPEELFAMRSNAGKIGSANRWRKVREAQARLKGAPSAA